VQRLDVVRHVTRTFRDVVGRHVATSRIGGRAGWRKAPSPDLVKGWVRVTAQPTLQRYFHPVAATACLWPASAGSRCPRTALAVSPARHGGWRKRRAARRGAALHGLDRRLRMCDAEDSGGSRCGGLGTAGWEGWGGARLRIIVVSHTYRSLDSEFVSSRREKRIDADNNNIGG
jgi:hypothetical protein